MEGIDCLDSGPNCSDEAPVTEAWTRNGVGTAGVGSRAVGKTRASVSLSRPKAEPRFYTANRIFLLAGMCASMTKGEGPGVFSKTLKASTRVTVALSYGDT